MFRYLLMQERLTNPEIGAYETFGIRIVDGTNAEIRVISDISLEKNVVLQLCEDCNRFELDPIHIDDIIEDLFASLAKTP